MSYLLLRDCVILCIERLRVEILYDFSHSHTYSGCIIYFSGGCVFFFVEGLRGFCREVA